MNIRHLFLEEDEPPKSAPKPNHIYTTPAPLPMQPLVTGSTPSILDNKAYQTLKQKISFESSDTGLALAKYLNPLKALPIDEHAKYKAAVAQGNAQEGLSADKILATFDGLKHSLEQEADHFEETAKAMEGSGVAEKIKRRDAIDQQLTTLHAEKESLSADIVAASQKIIRARNDFNTAVAAITQELNSEKERYSNLLKG